MPVATGAPADDDTQPDASSATPAAAPDAPSASGDTDMDTAEAIGAALDDGACPAPSPVPDAADARPKFPCMMCGVRPAMQRTQDAVDGCPMWLDKPAQTDKPHCACKLTGDFDYSLKPASKSSRSAPVIDGHERAGRMSSVPSKAIEIWRVLIPA